MIEDIRMEEFCCDMCGFVFAGAPNELPGPIWEVQSLNSVGVKNLCNNCLSDLSELQTFLCEENSEY